MYVQISPHKLTVRNARNGQAISEPPLVAIEQGAKPRILAVGSLRFSRRERMAGCAVVEISRA